MLFTDIINMDMVYLRPGDTIEKAILFFKQTKIDGLPVVTATRELIGVFTRTNLYNALLHRSSLEGVIDPWVTKDVYSLPESTPYEAVEEATKKSPVGSAPVVDKNGRVIGVFTKANMVLNLLKKSNLLNAQLTAILDAMHNGVVAFDHDGLISLINKNAEKILGQSSERLLGLPCDRVLTGLDLCPVLEQGEAKIGIKYQWNKIETIVNIMPIHDGAAVTGAIAIFHDLTELAQTARELELVRKLNRTLDTVINIINDGLIVVDEKGYITLINKTTADFLKVKQEEAINQHVTKLMEQSRLHVVAQSGIPELSEIQSIGDQQYLVSRLPIIKDGVPAGAVGKIIFPQLPEIRELIKKVNSLQSKVTYYKEELQKSKSIMVESANILGTSPLIIKLREEIQKVSQTNSTVLVTGESGTGKELIAQGLHYSSPRRNGPFVSINCAAIPEQLLESELFGYEPGAFSGANKNGKLGRFELANKGTILLDEIGDMSLNLQAKLLRIIQERKIERVGGTKTIVVDVRIIAATHRDLRKAVDEGTFRGDLYYRINVINLHSPPLRERKEDIELLLSSFIEKFNRILKTEITGFVPEVLDILLSYSWPGNIRELENVMERAANYAQKGRITPEHLPAYLLIGKINSNIGDHVEQIKHDGVQDYREKLNMTERDIILSMLDKTGGNKSKAAKLLNMSRTRFYSRLRKLGLV